MSSTRPYLLANYYFCDKNQDCPVHEIAPPYVITAAGKYSSRPVCVCECVCVCVPSFSVLAAATFSPHTRETPDLLSCCKKLSSISFSKAEKACGVPKSTFQNAALI